jgi:hypothetical protein
MRVGAQAIAVGEIGVATGAGRIAGRGRQSVESDGIIGSVWIVASGARHCTRAPTEQKVAAFARVDVAAARTRIAPATLPRKRIAGEQDLMTARTDAIDRCGRARIRQVDT